MRQSYELCTSSEIRSKRNDTNEYHDYGPSPFVINIEEAAERNDNYRTALWTGDYLQLTLMSIRPGGDIGLEIHPDVDQFLRVEEGRGLARMGYERDRMIFQEEVREGFAILIPAGTWHNVINTGREPLKMYSIYAPPQHPRGTIHETKEDAMAEE
jgi:mannose-6-phosphate isomerase-like protein (cupin superfamily)